MGYMDLKATASTHVQVFDPLLEKGKGKFSKHAAKEKKLNSEWRQTGGGSERPRMS